eukprot:1875456-Rhodomonas_salina.1
MLHLFGALSDPDEMVVLLGRMGDWSKSDVDAAVAGAMRKRSKRSRTRQLRVNRRRDSRPEELRPVARSANVSSPARGDAQRRDAHGSSFLLADAGGYSARRGNASKGRVIAGDDEAFVEFERVNVSAYFGGGVNNETGAIRARFKRVR